MLNSHHTRPLGCDGCRHDRQLARVACAKVAKRKAWISLRRLPIARVRSWSEHDLRGLKKEEDPNDTNILIRYMVT